MSRIKPFAACLQHQIIVLKKVPTVDIDHEQWQPKITTYAEIKAISETNYSTMDGFNFGNLITETYFMFRLRFVKGITNDMRIRFDDRIFEIKRVINHLERNCILRIIALEISNI